MLDENLEKVKLADRKRQEIARRIKARLERQRRQELERIRMMNAFAIVSSLAMMTVIDFLLAYWGGDWLDAYFRTEDHFWRKILLGLAGLTFALGVFKLIYLTKPMEEEQEQQNAEAGEEQAAVPSDNKTENDDKISNGNETVTK